MGAERVLIVEDHADSAEMVALFLRNDGHYVEIADDAGAALELFRRVRPSVVLLDVSMPIIDGADLARHIRTEDGAVRLFIVSAHPRDHYHHRVQTLGIERCFIKPVALDELARAVAKR